MKLKSACQLTLLGAALFALPALVQAQPTAHYFPGLEGIKAASLPPPGIYLRDYNPFYYSDRYNGPDGHGIGLDEKAYLYANVPRVIWITDLQVLGGFVGVDALLPLQYNDIKASAGGPPFLNDQTFGIGDFFFEATWSRHLKQFDLSLGYGVFAPTGDFSQDNPTRTGLGYWGHMLTAGATWYIDADKTWAVSVLNRYEFNMEQRDTDITPGQAYTVEGGVSYGITKTLDVGGVGYYQQKVTGDSGPTEFQKPHDRVAGVGPEVSLFIPSATLGLSLRYVYEFLAESRLQGHTATLTITKRF